MDNIYPNDLPAFLDPLLDYLADHLPSPVYNVLFNLLSYGLLFVSALINLVLSLPSWKPWEWDAQKVLPPLISVLAAYWTILSIYRTTTWMMRTSFWLLKWGVIVSVLAGGFGWMYGNGDNNAMYSAFQEALRHPQAQPSRSAAHRARPRPWESFDTQREWQYNEQEVLRAQEEAQLTDAQRVVRKVSGVVGRALAGAGYDFVTGAQTVFDYVLDAAKADNSDETGQLPRGGGTRQQPKRKAKSNAAKKGSSRSR